MNARATAMDFFQGKGWTKEQAAGIVGNLIGESNLDPTVKGDGGAATGIAQWHGDRWSGLVSHARQIGRAPTDLLAQLSYVDHELRTSERAAGQALTRARTVDEATAAVIGFERPAGWTAANPRGGHNYSGRLEFAQEVYGGGGDTQVPQDDGLSLSANNPYDTSDLNAYQPLTAQQVVTQANEEPGAGDPYENVFQTAAASASSDWYTSWMVGAMSEGAIDPNWNGPAQDVWEETLKEVPEQYHDYLLGASSQKAFEGRVKYALEDMDTQSRLAATPGSGVVRFITGIFDPVTLPVNVLTGGMGAEIVNGGRLLKATTGALSAGASNMALDASARELTGDPNTDPLMAFGMGAVLGGSLGALAKNPRTQWEAEQFKQIGRQSVDISKARYQSRAMNWLDQKVLGNSYSTGDVIGPQMPGTDIIRAYREDQPRLEAARQAINSPDAATPTDIVDHAAAMAEVFGVQEKDGKKLSITSDPARAARHNFGSGTSGYYDSVNHEIWINPQRTAEEMHTTLVHEMGHAIDYAVLREAPREEIAAVQKLWQEWAAKHDLTTMPGRDWIGTKNNDIAGGTVERGWATDNTKLSEDVLSGASRAAGNRGAGREHGDHAKYLASQVEWFAERFTRWYENSGEEAHGLADRFFKTIAAGYKKLLSLNHVEDGLKAWFDKEGKEGLARWTDALNRIDTANADQTAGTFHGITGARAKVRHNRWTGKYEATHYRTDGVSGEVPFIPGGQGNAGAAAGGKPPSEWNLDDHHVDESVFGNVRYDAVGQLTTSKEPRTRLMGWLFGEDPIGTKDHGVVDDPITVRQAALAMRRMAMVEKSVQVARAKFVEESGINRFNPIARAKMVDRFHNEVTDAIWAVTPDANANEHVLQAAEAYRRFYAEYQKDILNPRRESGGYAEPLGDVRSNPNYVPLYANHAKIAEIGNVVDEKVMEKFLIMAIQNHSPEIDVKLAKRMARGYWRNLRRAGYGIEEKTEMALSAGDRELFKSAYRELDETVDDETLDNLFDTLGGVVEKRMDDTANKPARLKRRTLMDYDFKAHLDGYGELRVRDLFNRDIEFVTRRYNRTMSARIALAQAQVRNPKTGEVFMDGIRSQADFDKLKNWVKEGWSEKYSGELQKDRDQMDRAMANMDFLWQAINGRPLYGSDQKYAQWVRRIKTFQFIRLMNNMGLNQIQETWKMVSTLGFKASMQQLPAIRRMVDAAGHSVPVRDQLLNELEDINGFGLDGLFGHYDFRVADDRLGAIEAGRATSRIDASLDWGSKLTADISLMKGIHTYQTRWAVKAISQRLLDIAKKTAKTDADGNMTFDFSTLKGMEKERLAAAGLGEGEAKLVLGNLLQHGTAEGTRLTALNASKWDPQAVTKFSYLMNRMVNRIVQQNSVGQLHRWMSAPAAQLFTQFRHFVFGAWGKSTLYNIHHFDPQTFVLMLGELMAGVATYAVRASSQLTTEEGRERFWEKTMDPVNLVKNGFARTATSSIIPMILDTGLMFTPMGPQFGSARASGQATDAIFGSPAISSLDDVKKFTSGAIDSVLNDREMAQTELRSGIRSLPFGNWLPLIGLFESMIEDREKFPPRD